MRFTLSIGHSAVFYRVPRGYVVLHALGNLVCARNSTYLHPLSKLYDTMPNNNIRSVQLDINSRKTVLILFASLVLF